MKIDSKYWGNLDFLILAKKPTLSMSLETRIIETTPSLSDQIYSYEDYDQAFSTAKASKQTGVIVVSNGFKDFELRDYFDNLAKYYETNGFPAVKCLLLEDDQLNDSDLNFINANDDHIYIIKESKALNETSLFLEDIAGEHESVIDKKVFPESLRNYLTNYAIHNGKNVELFSKQDLLNIISTPFNLNWFERFKLSNQYLINLLNEDELEILTQYQYLKRIYKEEKDHSSLRDIANSKLEFEEKLFHTANYFHHNINSETLHNEIQEVFDSVSFRSPLLIKGLSKLKDPLGRLARNQFKKVA